MALAVSVMMIEFGFMMMERYGWDLSMANLIASVFFNLLLAAVGLFFLAEHISVINAVGILICISCMALVNYKQT